MTRAPGSGSSRKPRSPTAGRAGASLVAGLGAVLAERAGATLAARAPAVGTFVAGIGAVRESRSWTFDPAIVLDQDIQDQKGRLVARAGQRVNPLSFVAMKTDLVFIDGRDDAQVDWALPAHVVDRRVRGVTPSPGAWTTWRGDRLRLGPVTPVADGPALPAGELAI